MQIDSRKLKAWVEKKQEEAQRDKDSAFNAYEGHAALGAYNMAAAVLEHIGEMEAMGTLTTADRLSTPAEKESGAPVPPMEIQIHHKGGHLDDAALEDIIQKMLRLQEAAGVHCTLSLDV